MLQAKPFPPIFHLPSNPQPFKNTGKAHQDQPYILLMKLIRPVMSYSTSQIYHPYPPSSYLYAVKREKLGATCRTFIKIHGWSPRHINYLYPTGSTIIHRLSAIDLIISRLYFLTPLPSLHHGPQCFTTHIFFTSIHFIKDDPVTNLSPQ